MRVVAGIKKQYDVLTEEVAQTHGFARLARQLKLRRRLSLFDHSKQPSVTRPIRSDEGGRPFQTRDGYVDNQFAAVWGFVANAGNPLLEDAFETIYDVFQDREREIETLRDQLGWEKP